MCNLICNQFKHLLTMILLSALVVASSGHLRSFSTLEPSNGSSNQYVNTSEGEVSKASYRMEDSLRRWEKQVDSDGKFPWAIYDFNTVRMNRTARHVYVDMGANWANTLRLWQDMGIKGENSSWEVYAFEASPLIQPYVERFTQWLNGKGSKPELTVPPAGSSSELNQYAARCGCPTGDLDAMRQCMWKTFEAQLNRLAPDPALNSSTLIEARLAEAKVRSPEQNRYTFIPAAVGVKDTYVSLSETSAKQMIRGGAHSDARPE